MSIPQLLEIQVTGPQALELRFDTPLDSGVVVPTLAFSVCYGQYPVESAEYLSTTTVGLTLVDSLGPRDEVFVTYQPPLDLDECLRAVLPAGSSSTAKKRNAVRAFFRKQALSQIAPNEATDGSRDHSNLGENALGKGYPNSKRPSNPRSATPDDFILAYGEQEAIQLTNLDNAAAVSVNVPKLEMAIQDANALIDSYVTQSSKAGVVIISSNRRRTALIVARYYLDSVRRREDVFKDYEAAMMRLEIQSKITSDDIYGEPAIETPEGILRTFRIPQRYNTLTGKGLSGWNNDPGWRLGGDYRDIQESAPGDISQPTDGGGVQTGNEGP